MKKAIALIQNMRIKHWIKNLFLFMPPIFGGRLFSQDALAKTALGFVIFCAVSSALYIFNDVTDIESDRRHPLKKERPIASGRLSKTTALAAAAFLIAVSLIFSPTLGDLFFEVTAAYILLQILYSAILKKTVILDIIAIALGFEARIWAGGAASSVRPSVWLELCVFVLAIFLGAIKRKHEKALFGENAHLSRDVLSLYDIHVLDQVTTIAGGLCIVFYGLYTISPETVLRSGTCMTYTIPFVIYGIFRYLYVVEKRKNGGDPGEVLLSDLPLIIDIILWLAFVLYLIYCRTAS